MLTLLVTAFFAGILTALAPCTLPIFPIIVGGSLAREQEQRAKTLRRVAVIIGSLAVSVFIFSLLLKATTALLGVPQAVWSAVAGGLVILLGLHFLFPSIWTGVAQKLHIGDKANQTLFKHAHKQSLIEQIATGAALGPVFNSCSPTYALIIALILPRSLAEGTVALLAYVIGMSLVLFVVAYYGSRVTQKIGWTLNEDGVFRKGIGLLFITVGFAIIFGFDRHLQTWLLDIGAYDGTLPFGLKL